MLQYLEVKNLKIQSSAPEKEWKSDTMIFKNLKVIVQAVERRYAFPFHKYHSFTRSI